MKIKTIIAIPPAILLTAYSVEAQGAFKNLNFELGNPVSANDPAGSWYVTTASALPDWTVEIGGVPQTEMGYNVFYTGGAGVQLESSSYEYAPAIDGKYSVFLQAGGNPPAVSISQSGLIPAGTQTLLFDAQQLGAPSAWEVLIGTQIVPFQEVGTGANYAIYGVNVAAWAGEPEDLTFLAEPNALGPNNWMLDDISFSPVGTPEPSIDILITCGGLLFGVQKWFKLRRFQ